MEVCRSASHRAARRWNRGRFVNRRSDSSGPTAPAPCTAGCERRAALGPPPGRERGGEKARDRSTRLRRWPWRSEWSRGSDLHGPCRAGGERRARARCRRRLEGRPPRSKPVPEGRTIPGRTDRRSPPQRRCGAGRWWVASSPPQILSTCSSNGPGTDRSLPWHQSIASTTTNHQGGLRPGISHDVVPSASSSAPPNKDQRRRSLRYTASRFVSHRMLSAATRLLPVHLAVVRLARRWGERSETRPDRCVAVWLHAADGWSWTAVSPAVYSSRYARSSSKRYAIGSGPSRIPSSPKYLTPATAPTSVIIGWMSDTRLDTIGPIRLSMLLAMPAPITSMVTAAPYRPCATRMSVAGSHTKPLPSTGSTDAKAVTAPQNNGF